MPEYDQWKEMKGRGKAVLISSTRQSQSVSQCNFEPVLNTFPNISSSSSFYSERDQRACSCRDLNEHTHTAHTHTHTFTLADLQCCFVLIRVLASLFVGGGGGGEKGCYEQAKLLPALHFPLCNMRGVCVCRL